MLIWCLCTTDSPLGLKPWKLPFCYHAISIASRLQESHYHLKLTWNFSSQVLVCQTFQNVTDFPDFFAHLIESTQVLVWSIGAQTQWKAKDMRQLTPTLSGCIVGGWTQSNQEVLDTPPHSTCPPSLPVEPWEKEGLVMSTMELFCWRSDPEHLMRDSSLRLYLIRSFALFVFMWFSFPVVSHIPSFLPSTLPPAVLTTTPATFVCLRLTTAALLGEVIRRSSTETHVQLLRAASSGF